MTRIKPNLWKAIFISLILATKIGLWAYCIDLLLFYGDNIPLLILVTLLILMLAVIGMLILKSRQNRSYIEAFFRGLVIAGLIGIWIKLNTQGDPLFVALREIIGSVKITLLLLGTLSSLWMIEWWTEHKLLPKARVNPKLKQKEDVLDDIEF